MPKFPKKEVKMAFEEYLKAFFETVLSIGNAMIDEEIVAEDPYKHAMKAIAKVRTTQPVQFEDESDATPHGTIFH